MSKKKSNEEVKCILIKCDGNRIQMTPNNKKTFGLVEITAILNSTVEPLFFNEWWIFKRRNIFELRYNEDASRLIGFPIYGDVLFVREDALEPYFFFPKEDMDAIMEEVRGDRDDRVDEDLDPIFRKIKEEQEEAKKYELISKAIEVAYHELFETNKTYDQIMKTFVVYKNEYGNQWIVKNDKQERLELLNNMLMHYLNIEEYEKCKNIQELYKYIDNFMN